MVRACTIFPVDESLDTVRHGQSPLFAVGAIELVEANRLLVRAPIGRRIVRKAIRGILCISILSFLVRNDSSRSQKAHGEALRIRADKVEDDRYLDN
jgi:hypothetical protein